RAAARPVSPRAAVRLSVALRGIRHPAAGGDGLRRAGGGHAYRRDPRICRRGGAAGRSRRPRGAARRRGARAWRSRAARRLSVARAGARGAAPVGAERGADDRAAGRGDAMRVGIDARKIADFGVGTYIRNLLRELAALGDHYVAFAPASAAALLPSAVEHVVVEAPHYSVRELVAVGRA